MTRCACVLKIRNVKGLLVKPLRQEDAQGVNKARSSCYQCRDGGVYSGESRVQPFSTYCELLVEFSLLG
jgi:hypothetical protein